MRKLALLGPLLLLSMEAAEGAVHEPGPEKQPEPVKPKPTSITAKMGLWNEPERIGNSEQVHLNAVYAEQGVNKQWATSTPAGQLQLTIDNPAAQGFFQKGKEYIVTIREAQPNE